MSAPKDERRRDRGWARCMTANHPKTAEVLKAERERTHFARFASAERPDIDLESIESCRPPAPDIACSTSTGERLAFELVELCPPEIAKAVGDDLKAGGGVSVVWPADPTERVLLKKLRNNYACDVPIDLLCYADGLLVTPDDVALARQVDARRCRRARPLPLDMVSRRAPRVFGRTGKPLSIVLRGCEIGALAAACVFYSRSAASCTHRTASIASSNHFGCEEPATRPAGFIENAFKRQLCDRPSSWRSISMSAAVRKNSVL